MLGTNKKQMIEHDQVGGWFRKSSSFMIFMIGWVGTQKKKPKVNDLILKWSLNKHKAERCLCQRKHLLGRKSTHLRNKHIRLVLTFVLPNVLSLWARIIVTYGTFLKFKKFI